ncbi:unnamed protein product [Gongylonema pulchrum]|uniref:OmpA-like domain-containing protein n=1 Tax=Gongylonema pulchrum TaxID=637853 RepID=A0A183E8L9_9BILA|nr:unnamed protein product [Gongylonema pulchrum]
MATARPAYSSKLEIDSPLFYHYIRGNSGCDLMSALEKQYSVKFFLSGHADAVYVEGMDEQNEAAIKTTLINAWKSESFRQ